MHTSDRPRGGVVTSHDAAALDAIASEGVQAVICRCDDPPPWLVEVAAAVRGGRFELPRACPHDLDRDALTAWLARASAAGGLDTGLGAALTADIASLADRLTALTGADRYTLRIFTEAPTSECGFHVDTVPPGTPTVGLLRVYSGAGTAYATADNVTSMADFYRYLARRERLVRDRSRARNRGDKAALDRLDRDIGDIDASPAFLLRPTDVPVAPAQAVVAFEHLDVRDHWSGTATAWIHSSPMAGETRLVVNLSAARPLPPSARRARSTSGRSASRRPS